MPSSPQDDESSQAASPVRAEAVGSPDMGAAYHATVENFVGCGFKVRLFSPSLRVELLSLGAAVNSVQVRNPKKAAGDPEEWLETCLGFATPEECLEKGAPIGITVGRFAGRIDKGEFDLNGTNYKLLQNEGGNTLHGGPKGFHSQQWKYILTEGEEEIGVSFHLTSPHLDQGFPGELFVTAMYTIPKSGATPTLKYVYQASLAEATPVGATVVSLANHTYWNLNGVARPAAPAEKAPLPAPIDNHLLQAKSTCIATTDDNMVPHGEVMEVDGTPYDYTTLRSISDGMAATRDDGREPWGFDDPIALEPWDSTLREAVVLYSPATKLRMTVHTTNPVVVIYTANHLPPDADGSAGQRFQQHSAVCLECQYFPNSPNVESFPSTTLRKGDMYSETTMHAFQFISADVHVPSAAQ